jgi:hypothetical protein
MDTEGVRREENGRKVYAALRLFRALPAPRGCDEFCLGRSVTVTLTALKRTDTEGMPATVNGFFE